DLAEDVDFNELAGLTEGYTGSDVSVICREALMLPIRDLNFEQLINDHSLVPRNPSRDDFINAVKNTPPSVMKKELQKYRQWADEFGS
ncbi:MAG: AAA family ATPase, partial [Candidatus Hodarchaeales archaeon]